MRWNVVLSTLAGVGLIPLAVPAAAVAQEDAQPMIYGVYMSCDPAAGDRVSEIIRDVWAPAVAPHVEAGHLSAWGTLTHHTGGPWNRVLYTVGLDRAQMMDALTDIQTQIADSGMEAWSEMWSSCGRHEDYIWVRNSGSQAAAAVGTARPSAGLSTYWVCDEGREAVADLIMEKYAALYNAQVEAGLLNSWGWYSHFVGGEYRRLLVLDGASHEDLLQARDNVIEGMDSEYPALSAEFSDVCNGHSDYLWNIESRG